MGCNGELRVALIFLGRLNDRYMFLDFEIPCTKFQGFSHASDTALVVYCIISME
jgi:hypothetical protein